MPGRVASNTAAAVKHESLATKTATASDEQLTRSEVKCLQDSCKDDLVWLASSAVCVYVHRQGLCNTNGIGYLHQATLGQPRCYNRLGCLTCNIGTCKQITQDQWDADNALPCTCKRQTMRTHGECWKESPHELSTASSENHQTRDTQRTILPVLISKKQEQQFLANACNR